MMYRSIPQGWSNNRFVSFVLISWFAASHFRLMNPRDLFAMLVMFFIWGYHFKSWLMITPMVLADDNFYAYLLVSSLSIMYPCNL